MSLPHVLLGLLMQGEASGWDLKVRLDEDASLGWNADLAQIYPVLKRLLRGGFVALKRRRSVVGPPRRAYRLTASGRRELRRWLNEPPELPRPKDAVLARLAFLERRAPEDRAAYLRAYRALVFDAASREAGATAARRRRRTLLDAEVVWADAEARMLGGRT